MNIRDLVGQEIKEIYTTDDKQKKYFFAMVDGQLYVLHDNNRCALDAVFGDVEKLKGKITIADLYTEYNTYTITSVVVATDGGEVRFRFRSLNPRGLLESPVFEWFEAWK